MVFLRLFVISLISTCAVAQVNSPATSQPMPPSQTAPAAPSQNAPEPSTPTAAPAQAAPQPQAQQGETAPTPPAAGAPTGPAATAPPAPAAPNVPENAPVITLKGVCSGTAARSTAATKTAAGETKTAGAATKPAAASSDCKTVITRGEWERMIAVINRPIPPQFRRQVAEQFVNLYELSNAGAKAGLEKDTKVAERLRLSRMQVLASAYMEKLREEKVSDTAVADYYKSNPSQFEEVSLKRIYVPKPAATEGKPPDEAAAKLVAQKIRDRAAAGEDFEKLQKEAYEATGNKGTPPTTDMGTKRRGSLPPKHEEDVFKLKAGEVSPAFEEQSGFFIYKLEKKDVAPLDQAKSEIERKLQEQKTKDAMDKLKQSSNVVYNDAYFGPPAAAGAPGAAGEPPSGPTPGVMRKRPAPPSGTAGANGTAAPEPAPPQQTPPK